MNATAVLDGIKSRVYGKLFADAAAAEATERATTHAELAGQLVEGEAADAAALMVLVPQVAKADEQAAKARAVANAADVRAAALRGQVAEVKARREHRRMRLGGQLEATADPRIDDARRRMEQRLVDIQRDGFRVESTKTGTVDGAWITRSNGAGLARVVRSISLARAKYDALKRVEAADLDAAIADIENSIPWSALDEWLGPDGRAA